MTSKPTAMSASQGRRGQIHHRGKWLCFSGNILKGFGFQGQTTLSTLVWRSQDRQREQIALQNKGCTKRAHGCTLLPSYCSSDKSHAKEVTQHTWWAKNAVTSPEMRDTNSGWGIRTLGSPCREQASRSRWGPTQVCRRRQEQSRAAPTQGCPVEGLRAMEMGAREAEGG